MKQLIKLIPFALIALLAFAGCEGPFSLPSGGETGGLNVVVTNGCMGARTVVPDSTLAFSKIELELTGPGNATESATLFNGVMTKEFTGLAAGAWTITARGYINISGDDKEIASLEDHPVTVLEQSGMQQLHITLGANAIDPTAADGTFAYSRSLQGIGWSAIQSETLTIIGIADQTEVSGSPIDITVTPSGTIDLSPGYYLVTFEAKDYWNQLAVKTEVVHIYSYVTTKWDIVLNANDFAPYITLSGSVGFQVYGETPAYYKIAVVAYDSSDYFYTTTPINLTPVPITVTPPPATWRLDIKAFSAWKNVRATATAYDSSDNILGTAPSIIRGVLNASDPNFNFTTNMNNTVYIAHLVEDGYDNLADSAGYTGFRSSIGAIQNGASYRVTYALRSNNALHQLSVALVGTASGTWVPLSVNPSNPSTHYVGLESWSNIAADTLYQGTAIFTANADYYYPYDLILAFSAGPANENSVTEADVTFYVLTVEKFDPVYVTLDANIDDVYLADPAPRVIAVNEGSPLGAIPAPQLVEGWGSGMTVSGWYYNQAGTGAEFTASTPVTGDITVYAQWEYNYSTAPYKIEGDVMTVEAPRLTTNQSDGGTQGTWSGSYNSARGTATYSGGAVRYMFPNEALDYDFVILEYVHEGNLDVILKQGSTSTNFIPRDGGENSQYPTLSGVGSFEFIIRGMTAGNNYGVAFQRNTNGTSGTIKWSYARFYKGERVKIFFHVNEDGSANPSDPAPIDVLIGYPIGNALPVPPPRVGYTFVGWYWVNGGETLIDANYVPSSAINFQGLRAKWEVAVGGPPLVVPGQAIDFSDAELTQVGTVNNYTETANSYTFDGSGNNFVKFKVNLGTGTLADYDLITFNLSGMTSYKRLDVIGDTVLTSAGTGTIPNTDKTVTTFIGGDNNWTFAGGGLEDVLTTYTIDKGSYAQGLTGIIELAVVADNAIANSENPERAYTIANFRLIKTLRVNPSLADLTAGSWNVSNLSKPDDNSFSYTQDQGSGWAFIKFPVDFGVGKSITDYARVTFTITSGPTNTTTFKKIELAAAETIPTTAGIGTGDALIVSRSGTAGGWPNAGWNFGNGPTVDIVLYFDADKKALLDGIQVLEIAIVPTDCETNKDWTISNIQFVPFSTN